MKKILVTGAFGLVGSDLVPALSKKFGAENVFALGNKTIPKDFTGQLVTGDVRDVASLKNIVETHNKSKCYFCLVEFTNKISPTSIILVPRQT